MGTLHRHQLAYLGSSAWARIGAEQGDRDARACIAQWAAAGLPVVVTRQPESGAGSLDRINVGLSAPAAWQRRRLGFEVARHEVLWFDEFPSAERAATVLPRPAREAWLHLCAALAATGAATHVYGSHGWECLSRWRHTRDGSDLDLWTAVGSDAQADAVGAVLASAPESLPRLDGELVFDDGSAVSWREWLAWRSGRTGAVLVRTLDRSFLRWSPESSTAVAPATWREAA